VIRRWHPHPTDSPGLVLLLLVAWLVGALVALFAIAAAVLGT